jgi:hypothetical protein
MGSRARFALAGCAFLVACAVVASRWVEREPAEAAASIPLADEAASVVPREAMAEPEPESPFAAGVTRVALEGPQPRTGAPFGPPAAQLGPDEALVRVRVLAAENGAPVADVRVLLAPDQDSEGGYMHVDRARARPGEVPRTGDDGWVEFVVPAGEAYDVRAVRRRSSAEAVPGLAPGATHEVLLLVLSEDDLVFFGRTVAAQDGSPVAGASVHLESVEGDRAPVISDTDGLFLLRGAIWRSNLAQAEAPGFAPVLFGLSEGHSSAALAFEVRLERVATLLAHVSDPSGVPAAGVRVSVSASTEYLSLPGTISLNAKGPTWDATTGEDGRCAVEGLPPLVPLALELHMKHYQRQAEPPLTLQPGETREIRLVAGGCVELRGLLLDQFGEPILDQRIVLLRPEDPEQLALTFLSGGETPVFEATTDREGRFTIRGVCAGTWLIGPAPANLLSFPRAPEPSEDLRVVACVMPVEVGTISPQEIRLSVDRGLYIRGQVLDSRGEPADEGWVSAYPLEESLAGLELTAEVEAGAFTLGPLAAGRWRLIGSGENGDADSEAVLADAGGRDVLLRLGPGSLVWGKIFDPSSGFPGPIEVVACPVADIEPKWGGVTDDLEFGINCLAPGNYGILARSKAKVGWLPGVVLAPGEQRTDLRIALEPGARLVIWNRLDRSGYVGIRLDGHRIGFVGVEAGTQSTTILPGGHAQLFLHLGEDLVTVERTIEVDLIAGEEREIVFKGEQR